MVVQVFKFLQHSETHQDINLLLVLEAQTIGLLVVEVLVLVMLVVLVLDHGELAVILAILQVALLMLVQEMEDTELELRHLLLL